MLPYFHVGMSDIAYSPQSKKIAVSYIVKNVFGIYNIHYL